MFDKLSYFLTSEKCEQNELIEEYFSPFPPFFPHGLIGYWNGFDRLIRFLCFVYIFVYNCSETSMMRFGVAVITFFLFPLLTQAWENDELEIFDLVIIS